MNQSYDKKTKIESMSQWRCDVLDRIALEVKMRNNDFDKIKIGNYRESPAVSYENRKHTRPSIVETGNTKQRIIKCAAIVSMRYSRVISPTSARSNLIHSFCFVVEKNFH